MSKNGTTEPILTRQQLEENVRVSAQWIAALKRGNFQGSDLFDMANLLGFLVAQNKKSTDDFEAAAAIHPEWGVIVSKQQAEGATQ
jgi:hypothetical protein